jgi:hypothetical protein
MAPRTDLLETPVTRRVIAATCLIAPFVALLWVPTYAATEPRLAGAPFFYWYQLAWIPASTLLMAIAYRLTRPHREDPHESA